MEMMQQWEPLLLVYIKGQMDQWANKRPLSRGTRERGEADKQFVHVQHYQRHTDGKHRQCSRHKAVSHH